jgi:hypothetical protein
MLGKRAAPEQLKLDQCWAKKDVELLQARCSIIKKQYYSALETKIKMQSKLPSVQPQEVDDVLLEDEDSEFSFAKEPLVDLHEKYDMENKQQKALDEAEDQAKAAQVQKLQEQVDQHLGQGPVINNFFDTQPIQEKNVEFLESSKTCNKCAKRFETHWELNQHKRRCRRPGACRVVLKKEDVYPCDFCQEQFGSSWKL